jgi:hypothetical protein
LANGQALVVVGEKGFHGLTGMIASAILNDKQMLAGLVKDIGYKLRV